MSEQTFLLTAGSETVPVRTPMIGRRHVYHCLAAAAVGLAYEIPLTTVVRGLEYAGHVPGRLERIECGQPFGVFIDYAGTPGALARALKTLGSVTAGRLICVFGAGGRRDQENCRLLAPTLRADGRPGNPGDFQPPRGDKPGIGRGRARRLCADCRQETRNESDRWPAARAAGRP